MKWLVVGSRSFTNYLRLKEILDKENKPDLIISGGAKGADKLAERYAKENNINFQEFKADWGTYGKKAGYLRNIEMVNLLSKDDKAFVFWDGESKGTKMMLGLLKQRSIPFNLTMTNSLFND